MRRAADGGPLTLFPEEEAALSARAVARRREHFTLGRMAAHAALEALGAAAAPVLRGAKGEPVWPAGVVGAITHTEGVAAAVVGDRARYAGIGVDLEPLEPGLGIRAGRLVCTPQEMAWATAPEDDPTGPDPTIRLTMLFCAKEAIFKALYPLTRVWLDFLGAELRWLPQDQAFDATLRVPVGERFPTGSTLRVTCRLVERMVLATTFVAAAPGSSSPPSPAPAR